MPSCGDDVYCEDGTQIPFCEDFHPSKDEYIVEALLHQSRSSRVVVSRRRGFGDRLFTIKVTAKYRDRKKIDHSKELEAFQLVADCNFLISQKHFFETNLFCYNVTDYYPGFSLLRLVESYHPLCLSNDIVKFYAAELLLAISSLHEKGIIHRDVKPNNVVLDSEGHIVLIDFDAVEIPSRESHQKAPIRGTLHYIAPEVYNRLPHDHTVDWWAYGLTLYYLKTGQFAFAPYTKDIDCVRMSVCYDVPQLQGAEGSLLQLLMELLHKEPRHRLGALGAKEIQAHPFFKGVDWVKMAARESTPPISPPDHYGAEYGALPPLED
ncbi:Protein kinase domain [Trinorchestia longiramus]|nr:Protein kinase domain [Trinorchestia longiramus]